MENPPKSKVIIIDDIPENIQVCSEILSPHYEIYFALNGPDGIRLVEQIQPDLLLLDIMMPGMTGMEVCKTIKQDKALADLPIIFLTALDDDKDIVKGFSAGAVDYITKPFNPPELIQRVKNHIELEANRKTIADQNRDLRELLQVLCHDLANPINFVVAIAELSEEDETLWAEHRNNIQQTMRCGLETIELVRHMRKLDEKKESFRLQPVELKRAVDRAFQMLTPQFERKGIKVNMNIPGSIIIIAEEISLINSVINNLLTNALKFSYPEGEVTVEAFDEYETVKLRVTDCGIGIPPEIIRDLFDISKATSRRGTENEIGTGFGMPLVKKFLSAYGATIQVQSNHFKQNKSDEATTVTLTFEKSES